MKCICLGSKAMRVPEEVAEEKVKSGWSYCSKSDFKKTEDKQTINKPPQQARTKPKKAKKSRVKSEDNVDPVDAMIKGKNKE